MYKLSFMRNFTSLQQKIDEKSSVETAKRNLLENGYLF